MANWKENCSKCYWQVHASEKGWCNLWAKDKEYLCKIDEGVDITQPWHNYQDVELF